MNNIAYLVVGITLALLLLASGYAVYTSVVDSAEDSISSSGPDQFLPDSEKSETEGTGFERCPEIVVVQV